jgi:hypothetical protein
VSSRKTPCKDQSEAANIQRRIFARFPVTMELRASLLMRVSLANEAEFHLLGETTDIARGGVCVVSDRTIPTNSVLRCEMVIPGSSIGVPTLMQVRWTEALDDRRFRIGLQFLL